MHQHGWKLVLLICTAIFVFLWLVKAPIMAGYITEKMKVPVTIRTVSIWPRVTTMRGFRIMNPPRYKSSSAFKAERTRISYRFGHITSVPSEIDEIVLDTVYLNIELPNPNGADNNWSAIGANMPKRKPGREVIVHRLVINNMTVEVGGKGARTLGVEGKQHFDQMVFTDIDSREGFPTKELISNIFQKAGLYKYIEKFLNPTDTIKDALSPFNIFGDSEE